MRRFNGSTWINFVVLIVVNLLWAELLDTTPRRAPAPPLPPARDMETEELPIQHPMENGSRIPDTRVAGNRPSDGDAQLGNLALLRFQCGDPLLDHSSADD